MRSRARAREVAIVSCMDSSDFRERRFAASKSRSSPREDATVRGRGLRLEQRSEKGPFAVNHRRGETCGVRVEALGARTDSDRPCKGSCGARKRPRGVARGGARTGCGRAAAGKRAFAVNGRCREVGTRPPPRGRARADSDRRRVGMCGFGPNLSATCTCKYSNVEVRGYPIAAQYSLFSSGSMLRTRVRPAAASASSLSSNVPQSRAPSSRRRRLGRLPVAGSRGCPRGCPRDCPRGSLRATLEAVLGVERASFAHAFRARIERTHWPRAHRGVRLLTRPPLMPRSVLLLAPALALPPYACTRRRRTRSAWTRPTRASARRPPP